MFHIKDMAKDCCNLRISCFSFLLLTLESKHTMTRQLSSKQAICDGNLARHDITSISVRLRAAIFFSLVLTFFFFLILYMYHALYLFDHYIRGVEIFTVTEMLHKFISINMLFEKNTT